MAIEQFVKHVEGLQQNHLYNAQSKGVAPSAKIDHLGSELIKLKDMLKQAMQQKNMQYR